MIDNSTVTAVKREAVPVPSTLTKNKTSWRMVWQQHKALYIMLIPAAILLVLLNFYPMWGVGIAFVKYNLVKGLSGSEFIGLQNFQMVFGRPETWSIIRNTVVIAVGKIILGQLAAVIFALMIHEVRFPPYKRLVQTLTTLPYFLSWIIVGAVMVVVLGSNGPVNNIVEGLGLRPIRFLADRNIFPLTIILSDVWKGFGFGAVIYLAALTQINPELYEAAAVDGAGRGARMRNITIPGITPTIVLMAALSLGSVLNAGFDQILVLYNSVVYSTGDIIDTWVYRVGLLGTSYEIATVVGLFKGAVGFTLILISYWLAGKYANYRIF